MCNSGRCATPTAKPQARRPDSSIEMPPSVGRDLVSMLPLQMPDRTSGTRCLRPNNGPTGARQAPGPAGAKPWLLPSWKAIAPIRRTGDHPANRGMPLISESLATGSVCLARALALD